MRYTVEYCKRLEGLLHDAGFTCAEHGVEKTTNRGQLHATENTYRRGHAWVKTSYYATGGGATFSAFVAKFKLVGARREIIVENLAARLVKYADDLDRRHAKLNEMSGPLDELLRIANIPFVRIEKKERLVYALKTEASTDVAAAKGGAWDDEEDEGENHVLFTLRFRRGTLVLLTTILNHEWQLESPYLDDEDDDDSDEGRIPQRVETYEDCLRVIRAQHDLLKKFLIHSMLPLCERDLVTMDNPGEYLQYMLDFGVESVSTHEHTVRSTTGNDVVDDLMVRGKKSEGTYRINTAKIVFKQPFTVSEPNE